MKLCGDDIYRIFIKEYTEKQWGRPATELPPFIIRRVPFRFVYNNNYFDDPHQGIPTDGYNALVDRLLEGVEVRINTNYFDNRAYFDGLARKTLFTGRIDEFFNYSLGRLAYRSLRFEREHLEIDDYQGNAVVNYNEREVPYTRIIEHKHFDFGTQPFTVITREYPQVYSDDWEPYYPINDTANMQLLERYRMLAAAYPDVLFGGRLGQYAYYDMDDAVGAAMKLAEQELTPQEHVQ